MCDERFIQQSLRQFSEKSQASSERILQSKFRSHVVDKNLLPRAAVVRGRVQADRVGYRCGTNDRVRLPDLPSPKSQYVGLAAGWTYYRHGSGKFFENSLLSVLPTAYVATHNTKCGVARTELRANIMENETAEDETYLSKFCMSDEATFPLCGNTKGRTSVFSLMFDLPYLLC